MISSGVTFIPVGDGLFRIQETVPASPGYPFGRWVSATYYNALRALALNLRYRQFSAVTGFGTAIHWKLRRAADFKSFQAL